MRYSAILVFLLLSICFSSESRAGSINFFCSTNQVSVYDKTKSSLISYKNFSSSLDDGTLSLSPGSDQTLSSSDYTFALESSIWKRSQTLYPSRSRPLHIGVYFLDGRAEIKAKVLKWASEWTGEGKARIIFEEAPQSQAQIRISFDTGLNQSAIGSQALNIKDTSKPTMELFDVGNMQFSQERWKSVTLHEFGHAIGLRHEHSFPGNMIPWNEENILNDYLGKKWARCGTNDAEKCLSDIKRFITTPLSAKHHRLGEFDQNSIMIYPVPNEWTNGDYEISAPDEISSKDSIFTSEIYP